MAQCRLTPAKVFAMLKSKVQNEAAYEEKNNVTYEETLNLKEVEHPWKTNDHKFSFYAAEAEPLIVSPIASPEKRADRQMIIAEQHFEALIAGMNEDLEPECQPRVEPSIEEKSFSPDVFSPIRNRLRKRKWELPQFKKNFTEMNKEVFPRPPHERRTSTPIGETGVREAVEGCESRDLPPVFSPKKKCVVVLQQIPPQSPAKVFASMKKREICKINSTEEPDDRDHSCPSRTTLVSMTSADQKMEGVPFGDAGSVLTINRSRMEAADGVSESELVHDVPLSPQPTHPVLLEDPLVLMSPRVNIPKKKDAGVNMWPPDRMFPKDSIIFLKKWFLDRNRNGLFVCGIHRDDNIPWNSNTVVERYSSSEIRTVSGRIYILLGRMNRNVGSDLPKWLLKRFSHGFPSNWKILYNKFLSESRNRVIEMKSKEKRVETHKLEAKLHLKRVSQTPLKNTSACASTSSGLNVSRSGRIIKPPLEYWKGGRVILDAQMNVTIHEGYNTSILNPDVMTTVSPKTSQKPARCSKGRNQCRSTRAEPEVLQRKVKPHQHKRNQTNANSDTKQLEDTLSNRTSSPEDWCDRNTRANHRYPQRARTFNTKSIPQVHSPPEPPRTGHSKNQKQNSKKVISGNKHSSQMAKDALAAETSLYSSSMEEFPVRRSKRARGGRRKTGQNVMNESPSTHEESLLDIQRTLWSKTRVERNHQAAQIKKQQSEDSDNSPPPKPLPNKKQYVKRHNKLNKDNSHESDKDTWTEAELMKLQEAVHSFSKHRSGYWEKVANIVGTRSAEECHKQQTSHGNSKSPVKKAKKPKKVDAPKDGGSDPPVISARVGTLKRKQELRKFLEAMPTENVDDAFSTAYMKDKRFELPSMSSDDDFISSDLEPLTPKSAGFFEAKTPQCLHITPRMLSSPNRKNDDKYVYQLQKRVKKYQFTVHNQVPSKRFTATPSIKQKKRQCTNTENDAFIVWEMFPDQDLSESGEEEDCYFSDND